MLIKFFAGQKADALRPKSCIGPGKGLAVVQTQLIGAVSCHILHVHAEGLFHFESEEGEKAKKNMAPIVKAFYNL